MMIDAFEARQHGINTHPALDQEAATASQEVSDQSIEAAIAEAHTACQTLGEYSSECADAWDTVEEMQAAKANQDNQTQSKSAFEHYCEQRPDADECRVYDV